MAVAVIVVVVVVLLIVFSTIAVSLLSLSSVAAAEGVVKRLCGCPLLLRRGARRGDNVNEDWAISSP